MPLSLAGTQEGVACPFCLPRGCSEARQTASGQTAPIGIYLALDSRKEGSHSGAAGTVGWPGAHVAFALTSPHREGKCTIVPSWPLRAKEQHLFLSQLLR